MTDPNTIITTADSGPAYWLCCGSQDPLHTDKRLPDCCDATKARFGTRLRHAEPIVAAMARQREQELAGDDAHHRLRKACQARAVELYFALKHETGHAIPHSPVQTYAQVDQLMKEIDDASH